jgi:hypothetical protein
MPYRRLCAVLVAVLTLTGLALAAPASAATASPKTPTGMPTAIEPLADEVSQTSCDPFIKPGTAKLASLLVHTYPATHYASAYACGSDGNVSEHYDGRAIDWMVSIRNVAQYADAKAVLSWLLATDSRGNRLAVVRRLGVQYLIYNNRIWESWDGKWHAYNGCASLTSRNYDTSCHRDHMHISLGWNGAMGATTFWTKTMRAADQGPCRVAGLNWALPRVAYNPKSCPSVARLTAAASSSSLKRTLVKYSGAYVHLGLKGPVVVAVQQALHISASGTYGTATRTAVIAFQRRHHRPVTGTMNPLTWLTLLAAVH